MSPTTAFILGLLIGLIIEWVIDWLYWRRRTAALQTELDQTKAKMAAAGSASTSLKGRLVSMTDADSMQQRNNVLEADKAALNQQLVTLKAEKASLEDQLRACQGKLSAGVSLPAVAAPPMPAAPTVPTLQGMETPTVRMTQPVSTERDDLLIIKGIGPVINLKLNQGGVYTFAQLAALTPARLREIVGDVIQRLADEDEIIAQAKELAARKAGGG